MYTYPLTEVQPVITNNELADWLGVDATDPLLPVMATSATSLVIEYLQSELISRQRKVIYKDWPSVGTNTAPSISPNNQCVSQYVDLPYARLLSVVEVKTGGVITIDFVEVENLPAQLYFDNYYYAYENGIPAIEATYTAGFGTISDVPQTIRTAVTMLGDYLYGHRGACDISSAIHDSGAASILIPFKTHVVAL